MLSGWFVPFWRDTDRIEKEEMTVTMDPPPRPWPSSFSSVKWTMAMPGKSLPGTQPRSFTVIIFFPYPSLLKS